LTLSHTLECRLNIDTFLETLTHTLTRKTNYAWNDLGDLDGTSKVTDTVGIGRLVGYLDDIGGDDVLSCLVTEHVDVHVMLTIIEMIIVIFSIEY